jgi:hypothetical protein
MGSMQSASCNARLTVMHLTGQVTEAASVSSCGDRQHPLQLSQGSQQLSSMAATTAVHHGQGLGRVLEVGADDSCIVPARLLLAAPAQHMQPAGRLLFAAAATWSGRTVLAVTFSPTCSASVAAGYMFSYCSTICAAEGPAASSNGRVSSQPIC